MNGVEIISSSAIVGFSGENADVMFLGMSLGVLGFAAALILLGLLFTEPFSKDNPSIGAMVCYGLVAIFFIGVAIWGVSLCKNNNGEYVEVGTKYYIKVDSSASLIEFNEKFEIIDTVTENGTDDYSYYWVKEK